MRRLRAPAGGRRSGGPTQKVTRFWGGVVLLLRVGALGELVVVIGHQKYSPSGLVVMSNTVDSASGAASRGLANTGRCNTPAATVTAVRLRLVCEVCGVEELLTSEAAYETGWDYPPRMGVFGVVGPRTCPDCAINETVWWAIEVDGYTVDMLAPNQRATVARILAEPDSVVEPPPDGGG